MLRYRSQKLWNTHLRKSTRIVHRRWTWSMKIHYLNYYSHETYRLDRPWHCNVCQIRLVWGKEPIKNQYNCKIMHGMRLDSPDHRGQNAWNRFCNDMASLRSEVACVVVGVPWWETICCNSGMWTFRMCHVVRRYDFLGIRLAETADHTLCTRTAVRSYGCEYVCANHCHLKTLCHRSYKYIYV